MFVGIIRLMGWMLRVYVRVNSFLMVMFWWCLLVLLGCFVLMFVRVVRVSVGVLMFVYLLVSCCWFMLSC